MAKSWSECNKPHHLAMEFLGTIGKRAFVGGKPSRDFFKVYNFFKKLDVAALNLFHEYLVATGSNPRLTMKGLFYEAPAWNQKQRTAKIAETHIEDYLELLKEW
ncbi:hypothetical protein [Selenomonas ruminantium]|nr:hypothetical protein [Selenomonas ruminantium]